jgi:cytochrome c553
MTYRPQGFKRRFCGAVMPVLLLAGWSAGDADEVGRAPAMQCVACHGAVGISDNAAWPDLAGQSAAYLAKQLEDFRAGRRDDPWMTQMAVPLNDQTIGDLAMYFSGLQGLTGSPEAAPAAAQICVACHSSRAITINPLWPALAGQNAAYLAKALRDYRAGARTDPVMVSMAAPMSDADIDQLAAWFAGVSTPGRQQPCPMGRQPATGTRGPGCMRTAPQ